MRPKGDHHEVLKAHLNVFFASHAPRGVMFAPETTFHRISSSTKKSSRWPSCAETTRFSWWRSQARASRTTPQGSALRKFLHP